MYQRWHECQVCHYSVMNSVQMDKSDLWKLLRELKELRAIKAKHERLISALREKQEIDDRIQELVLEPSETKEVVEAAQPKAMA